MGGRTGRGAKKKPQSRIRLAWKASWAHVWNPCRAPSRVSHLARLASKTKNLNWFLEGQVLLLGMGL